MNAKEKFEIENAIWRAQADIIPVCLICGRQMNMLDAKTDYAWCWSCRKRLSNGSGPRVKSQAEHWSEQSRHSSSYHCRP